MSHLEITLHMTSGATIVFPAENFSVEKNRLGDFAGCTWKNVDDPTMPGLNHVRIEHVAAITSREVNDEDDA